MGNLVLTYVAAMELAPVRRPQTIRNGRWYRPRVALAEGSLWALRTHYRDRQERAMLTSAQSLIPGTLFVAGAIMMVIAHRSGKMERDINRISIFDLSPRAKNLIGLLLLFFAVVILGAELLRH
ncbi:hypothetical protein [Pseudolabrys taiwanensis]|nr:hypothetical protein [Pseudolabrys taiwanensis]